MAYATTTQVAYYNAKRTYNTTSRPTGTQLTGFINSVYYEMNARLIACGAITTALTATSSTGYKYLSVINAIGAAGYAEESAFMGGNKQDSEHANSLLEKYESMMQRIENSPSIIAGTSGAAFWGSLEQDDTDEQRDEEPFERSVDKW